MQEPLDNLSEPAKLAYRSLTYEPELNTPEAIANGPYGVDQYDAGDIADGLRELAAGGHVTQIFGGWSTLP
jgi:hypothetical protein